jgi:hypothetical protein
VEIADERTGIVEDYTRMQGIEHREIVAPADAPEWVQDRRKLPCRCRENAGIPASHMSLLQPRDCAVVESGR